MIVYYVGIIAYFSLILTVINQCVQIRLIICILIVSCYVCSTISGLTMETVDAHLMKATLEGICFQTKDVLRSMQSDTGHSTTALNVDGGMVVSDTFMQILTNICGIDVGKPHITLTHQ